MSKSRTQEAVAAVFERLGRAIQSSITGAKQAAMEEIEDAKEVAELREYLQEVADRVAPDVPEEMKRLREENRRLRAILNGAQFVARVPRLNSEPSQGLKKAWSLLTRNLGGVVSTEEIERVGGYDGSASVGSAIGGLRSKGALIATMRGRGYVLVPELEEVPDEL